MTPEDYKQLDEAAEKYSKQFDYAEDSSPQIDFIEGAKYMAERMYSEDEVRAMIEKALTHNDYDFCGFLVTTQGEIRTANFGIWFEENKKK